MPATTALVSDVLLVGTVASAAVWDVRLRRVPNLLVLCAGLAALLLQGLNGWSPLASAAAAAAGALVLGFALFAGGIMGAGDAKLLAAVAAFLGLHSFLPLLATVALAGGALALGAAARQRLLGRALRDSGRLTAHVLSMGMVAAPERPEPARGMVLPYAVAIAAGAVVTRFLWR